MNNDEQTPNGSTEPRVDSAAQAPIVSESSDNEVGPGVPHNPPVDPASVEPKEESAAEGA